ncbi:hypothetical protein GF314_06265 [bacterium]|nr:hypothetical protein [bacterium]
MHANPSSRSLGPLLLAGLFWGAIWGLYEATVGYLVHAFVRMPGTSAVLLVPFAVYCMVRAMAASGTVRAAGVAAIIAASIKLVDLLLPNPTLIAVLNPAMAIVLEGAVFVGVGSWLSAGSFAREGRRPALGTVAVAALVFSLGWRVLFLTWSAALAAGWSTGMLTGGWQGPVLGFVLRDGLMSAVVIVGVLAVAARGVSGARGGAARAVPGASVVAAVLVLAVAAEVAVVMLG